MKTYFFNIQSKGGAGKSMCAYLLGLKNEQNEKSYFVDLDSSVKSSLQQLKFLQGKAPPRFAVMNLLDLNNKIDRQLFFDVIAELNEKNYDEFYLDFGAPESDQFTSLFSKDYSIEEFKQIEEELNAKFIFNVIVAGGGAYTASTTYLSKIGNMVNGLFDVNIYVNEYTFANYPHLIDELKSYFETNKRQFSSLKYFGDFDPTTAPHKSILRKIEQGEGISAYAFVEKIKIKKEISKV